MGVKRALPPLERRNQQKKKKTQTTSNPTPTLRSPMTVPDAAIGGGRTSPLPLPSGVIHRLPLGINETREAAESEPRKKRRKEKQKMGSDDGEQIRTRGGNAKLEAKRSREEGSRNRGSAYRAKRSRESDGERENSEGKFRKSPEMDSVFSRSPPVKVKCLRDCF
ncbi:hypothetical protein EUGRSUZ_J02001 [Eucalyptus grandis]|uniref:Uncharacterized protein n=2 Tax=Eucalyptus grandis TaxID=71139 RepID=A0ACC3J750_EUCGR|nr:hypothetical protein EUGRSUZ_J02001 [Eucalyptus grandis]